MNKQDLDKFLTTEPDNGFISFVEKIWSEIKEEEITGEEYNNYEYFFSYWENNLSLSGVRSLRNPSGFPKLDFCVDVIKRRYRLLKFLLAENWEMETPDLFVSPITGKKYNISDAFEIAYNHKNPPKLKN